MTEAADMTLPPLGEMRAEVAIGFADNEVMHRRTQARLGKMEETLTTFPHALSADSLLSKLETGEFEKRLEVLEREVRELGSSK